MSQLKERATKFTERPMIAHLLRANTRFGDRLGNQFGAAITYFSVLAMVPIMMFAFSIVGFSLVVVAPDLKDELLKQVESALSGFQASSRDRIIQVIENALENYAAIGIIGLLTAVYSGAGWMGNLKNAVRAQWRPSFDIQIKKENFLIKNVSNLVILLGFLVLIGITFGLATVSTSLSDNIIGWIGLDQVGWLRPVLAFVPIIISIGAGWLVFMYLYAILPETREPWSAVRRGALLGAIGLGILQYLTSFLIGRFASSATAALFGPVIALMLFFNLFARLVLFVAAWIGTAEHPAEPEFVTANENGQTADGDGAKSEETSGTRTRPQPVGAGSARPQTAGVRKELSPAAASAAADSRGNWSRTPGLIPEEVAARSVRVGAGAGYVTGAATGAGAGALLAVALRRIRAGRFRRAAR